MTYYLVMIRANIHEVKAGLSRLLDRVAKGETVLVCRRNVPIAEIRAVPPARTRERPLGLGRHEHGPWSLPESYFEPLPEELLTGFEGGSR